MAIPNLINVSVLVAFFYSIFGIIGVNFFKGQFFSCTTENIKDDPLFTDLVANINNKWDCLNSGGVWTNANKNFDNIFSAMYTLLQIGSLDGWSDLMINGLSINGIDNVM